MQPEDLSIGVVLGGRYRLEAELARGPESRVFRAAETRTGREVALKVLARDPSDKTWASRFRREANLARELQHPNTVPIHTLWDDIARRPAGPDSSVHALGWMRTDAYLALAERSLETQVVQPLRARGVMVSGAR